MGVSAFHTRTTDKLRDVERSARLRRVSLDVALRRLLGAGDAVAVLIATVIAVAGPLAPRGGHRIVWGLLALPLMIVLFKLYGLYDRDVKRISHSTVDDLPWLFHAVIIGTLLLWVYSRFSPLRRMDFAELLVFGSSAFVVVTAVRALIRSISGRVIGVERALLVGNSEIAWALVDKLDAHPEYGVEVIGLLSTDDSASLHTPRALKVLGGPEDLERLVDRYGANRVLVSAPEIEESELDVLLRQCRALSLKLSILPRLSDMLGPAVEVDDVEGVAVLGLNPPNLPRSSRAIKRGIDIAVGGLLLAFSAPLLLLLAVAIKIESRGPVFFKQERIGKGGRPFRVFKLRTMVADAEARRAELLSESNDPDWLLLDHDPRITRIGQWLRRLSLDELPQLWNVVRGDMSMVGPRPLIPAEDERVKGWARGRLDLTPGITGYWQVLGRTRIPFEEMVKLDYLYVMNWSLWEDLKLMLKTLPVVIGGRGVN